MTGATRLQVRPRAIAAITALLFVACGVLAMRHEASVTHVRGRAGGYVHAPALAGHHGGHTSDIHGQRDAEAETGECALLTTFHQAASAQIGAPTLHSVVVAVRSDDAPGGAIDLAAAAVYRLAPKTSPPALV